MSDSNKYENVLIKGYRLQGGEREYVIEDILGRGGFGITYKVKAKLHVNNIAIDAFFAVKEYFPDICWRDENDNSTLVAPKTKKKEVNEGLKDFINEGRKLQSVCNLNHNIVSVNEVFEANSTAYYVLEYLEGGDLRKRLKDNGRPLSEQQMLDVMIPMGHAVQCLHDNNILHLDIKPSNIVMRKNNDGGEDEPVLIDFGIAVHFNSGGTPTSKTPSLGISAGYSPIEQYSELKVFDPRLDVYAFAATCFYLLTGKIPIEALNLPAGYVQSALPPEVSPHVKKAIAHAMSKEKDYRTSSINELLRELTTIPVPPAVVKNNAFPPAPPASVESMPLVAPIGAENMPLAPASGAQEPPTQRAESVMPPVAPVGVDGLPPAAPVGVENAPLAPASGAQEPPTQRALENNDPDITGDVAESETKGKNKKKIIIFAIIAALLVAAAIAIALIFLLKDRPEIDEEDIPYSEMITGNPNKDAEKLSNLHIQHMDDIINKDLGRGSDAESVGVALERSLDSLYGEFEDYYKKFKSDEELKNFDDLFKKQIGSKYYKEAKSKFDNYKNNLQSDEYKFEDKDEDDDIDIPKKVKYDNKKSNRDKPKEKKIEKIEKKKEEKSSGQQSINSTDPEFFRNDGRK